MTEELKEPVDITDDKLDQIIELLKAIDWKLWLYLRANKYLDE